MECSDRIRYASLGMNLSWEHIHVHTRYPFKIARPGASVDGVDVHRIIVCVEHEGIKGFGEAAPARYYGQDLDSVEQTLRAIQTSLPKSPEPISAWIDPLLHRFDGQRAAICALDVASHDWLGKKMRMPVWDILGLSPQATPPTAYTIGIDTPEVVAKKLAEAGKFSILKIKVGTQDDLEMLETIRRLAPDKGLYLDANGGWAPSGLRERIASVARFAPLLIEQPLAAGSFEVLRALSAQDRCSLPLIADEDCVRLEDLDQLVGIFDGVNIKLAKCGGLVEARRMITRAKALNLKVMLGCMVETSLGISAAIQLASLADFVDLDSHLLLADDPFEGLGLVNGVVTPNSNPGLGIAVRRGETQP